MLNQISQIITFISCCFICSPRKTCQWRCNEVQKNRRVIKNWKYVTTTMTLLHCELYWKWDTFQDGSFYEWRTRPWRINETSNMFVFAMHHYEIVNLSVKRICMLWSTIWSWSYNRSTWGLFTVGGGTYREKTDLIKIKATGGLLQFFNQRRHLSFWSIVTEDNKNFIDLL